MLRLFILLSLLLPAYHSAADEDLSQPFAVSNLNPFVQIHGIPLNRSARMADQGKLSLQLQTEFASHFTNSTSGAETITLDGETHKATLSLRYGITDRFELGLDVPWVRHTGGSLDAFIENWHDTFGLPNGGREKVMDDQLAFRHQVGDLPITSLTKSSSGIGDLQLIAGYRWRQTDTSQWTIRGGIKIPTGDALDLTGSEASALFVSADHSNSALLSHPDWTFHGRIGAMLLEDGEVLENQQENWIVFGSATIAWQVTSIMSLKAQLDLHSAAYDSDLKELGDVAAQLVLGGSLRLGKKLALDVSVSEDIITDTSPDVVLQVGLRTVF